MIRTITPSPALLLCSRRSIVELSKKWIGKRERLRLLLAVISWGFYASLAQGSTVDGALGIGEYGPAIVAQNINTGFGNNQNELNAAFGRMTPTGDMELMITGNLEPGGNGLVLFIDARPSGGAPGGIYGSVGGMRTDDWGTDVDGEIGISPTPGGPSNVGAGFNPEFSIEINAGDVFSSDYYINVIDLTLPNQPNVNRDVFLGSNAIGGPAVTQTYLRDGGATPAGTVAHAFDNTNTAGINGLFDATAGDPLTATTGLEFVFDSTFLGTNPGDTVMVMAFITNVNGEFLSNQFLPGLEGTSAGADPDLDNLGGAGGLGGIPLFDVNEFTFGGGPAYFTVVPEPSSLALAVFGCVALAAWGGRRRKR